MNITEIYYLSGIVTLCISTVWYLRNYIEKKVQRVYKRLDEHKKVCDTIFVRKDMCDQTHRYNTQILEELKTQIAEVKKLVLQLINK